MIRTIFLYLLLTAAVLLGLLIRQDPGYALFAYGQWTVEMPLWFCGASLFFILACWHLISKSLNQLHLLRFRWHNFLTRRSSRASQKHTNQGLIAFSEGYWRDAEKELLKGIATSEAPLINLLTAARAAEAQANCRQRDKYLREAEKAMPEAKVAVLLTQAELQIASRQFEQAHATLSHLQTHVPKHPHVLKLLLDLHIKREDWAQLLNLLPKLLKYRVIDNSEHQALEQQAYRYKIKRLNKPSDHAELISLWKKLPKGLQLHPEITAAYARNLLGQGDTVQAELTLRQSLKKCADPLLLELYSEIKSTDLQPQLNFLESTLKTRPNDPYLLLALGKIAQKLQLWGKSKSYFEKSLGLLPSAETYYYLGQLSTMLNEHPKACEYYTKGLSLTVKQHQEHAEV